MMTPNDATNLARAPWLQCRLPCVGSLSLTSEVIRQEVFSFSWHGFSRHRLWRQPLRRPGWQPMNTFG